MRADFHRAGGDAHAPDCASHQTRDRLAHPWYNRLRIHDNMHLPSGVPRAYAGGMPVYLTLPIVTAAAGVLAGSRFPAFAAAALDFVAERGADFGGRISFLITGDEEGPSINGTVKLLDWAARRGERFEVRMRLPATVATDERRPAAHPDRRRCGAGAGGARRWQCPFHLRAHRLHCLRNRRSSCGRAILRLRSG